MSLMGKWQGGPRSLSSVNQLFETKLFQYFYSENYLKSTKSAFAVVIGSDCSLTGNVTVQKSFY